MGDFLEHGGEESPDRRRLIWALTVTVAIVVVAFVVVRSQGSERPAASGSGTSPTSTSSVAPSASDGIDATESEGQQAWPTEAAACGNTVLVPQLSTAPLHEATGLTLLVGGAGLRLVDVDSGAVRELTGMAGDGSGDDQVTALAASRAGVNALRVSCSTVVTSSAGAVLTVDTRRRATAAAIPGELDDLLSAPDATWAYSYPDDPMDQLLLRPVGGGTSVRPPVGFLVGAATSREFIGNLARPGEQRSAKGEVVAAVSRSDPTKTRNLGHGWVVAATDAFVLTSNACGADSRCVFASTRRDGSVRRYPMPNGRIVTSRAVLSPNGRYVAFQLARRDPDPRYAAGHPFGPSDLAILDLTTGKLQLVPGAEIAPKAGAGFTFSHDDRWLIITLNMGRSTRLLLWRPGLHRPVQSPARLPGPVLYSAPVLDVTADR